MPTTDKTRSKGKSKQLSKPKQRQQRPTPKKTRKSVTTFSPNSQHYCATEPFFKLTRADLGDDVRMVMSSLISPISMQRLGAYVSGFQRWRFAPAGALKTGLQICFRPSASALVSCALALVPSVDYHKATIDQSEIQTYAFSSGSGVRRFRVTDYVAWDVPREYLKGDHPTGVGWNTFPFDSTSAPTPPSGILYLLQLSDLMTLADSTAGQPGGVHVLGEFFIKYNVEVRQQAPLLLGLAPSNSGVDPPVVDESTSHASSDPDDYEWSAQSVTFKTPSPGSSYAECHTALYSFQGWQLWAAGIRTLYVNPTPIEIDSGSVYYFGVDRFQLPSTHNWVVAESNTADVFPNEIVNGKFAPRSIGSWIKNRIKDVASAYVHNTDISVWSIIRDMGILLIRKFLGRDVTPLTQHDIIADMIYESAAAGSRQIDAAITDAVNYANLGGSSAHSIQHWLVGSDDDVPLRVQAIDDHTVTVTKWTSTTPDGRLVFYPGDGDPRPMRKHVPVRTVTTPHLLMPGSCPSCLACFSGLMQWDSTIHMAAFLPEYPGPDTASNVIAAYQFPLYGPGGAREGTVDLSNENAFFMISYQPIFEVDAANFRDDWEAQTFAPGKVTADVFAQYQTDQSATYYYEYTDYPRRVIGAWDYEIGTASNAWLSFFKSAYWGGALPLDFTKAQTVDIFPNADNGTGVLCRCTVTVISVLGNTDYSPKLIKTAKSARVQRLESRACSSSSSHPDPVRQPCLPKSKLV